MLTFEYNAETAERVRREEALEIAEIAMAEGMEKGIALGERRAAKQLAELSAEIEALKRELAKA